MRTVMNTLLITASVASMFMAQNALAGKKGTFSEQGEATLNCPKGVKCGSVTWSDGNKLWTDALTKAWQNWDMKCNEPDYIMRAENQKADWDCKQTETAVTCKVTVTADCVFANSKY